MIITTIKISQEINFNGMPTWIGIEASILPDEDEKEGLRKIQKVITEYHQEEQQAFGKSRWAKNMSEPAYGAVDEEFEAVKAHLDTIEFQEEALEYLKTTGFHLSVEAKSIANSKPNKK